MKPKVLPTKELDLLAWNAICKWPERSEGEFTFAGLDFTLLSRWFLWDKVGRAIRKDTSPEVWTFERHLLEDAERKAASPFPSPAKQPGVLGHLGGLFSRMRLPLRARPAAGVFQRRSGKLLYAPVVSPRLKAAAAALAREGACQVVSRHLVAECPGVICFQPNIPVQPDLSFSDYLVKGIRVGLGGFGIVLEERDENLLRRQTEDLTALVQRARGEFERLLPEVLLVHADNHPPFQPYVMIAQEMKIPSVMLQHGLDCERFYLDEAYASHVAVWGPERDRRYRENSTQKPEIRITGNPEYDRIELPASFTSSGNYWLWATRPHTSEKCYAPSRDPREGLQILAALIKALRNTPGARLVIKPHPYDYRELYRQEIARAGLQDRITVSDQNILEMILAAALVVSEDSTAAIEAMFHGKLLIHAHFCQSKPTMPFVDYGAALPGFSSEELIQSLARAEDPTPGEKAWLLKGQRRFLEDFAGPCDGRAGERVVSFIDGLLKDGSQR